MLIILICVNSKSIFHNPRKENTVIDTTKLESINDSILFHKGVIIIYKDSLKNEVQKIDYISNDSAIKLFRELVNE